MINQEEVHVNMIWLLPSLFPPPHQVQELQLDQKEWFQVGQELKRHSGLK